MRIELTDNNLRSGEDAKYDRRDISPLFDIGGKTIEVLCRENPGLLVFPQTLGLTNDKIADSHVIDILNTSDPDKVSLRTGNIMGFIGVADVELKIKSRFDKGHEDFLLHYMLQKVTSFNLFDLNFHTGEEDIFDFMIFMFPYFLKSAMRKGVYREYRSHRHNDTNLRGPIDIARHISNNIPFNNRIAYNSREYCRDNDITQLIRHTIELLITNRYGNYILNIDRETAENVKCIIDITPNYNKGDRRRIISRNLRSRVHPYYTEYQPLRNLCIQILRYESIKYGECNDEIFGILFDGAWLWEEYVATLLTPLGFDHPENKLSKNGIHIFADESGIRYPDFYNHEMVLDAKYKRIGSYDKVSRVEPDDVHQVMAYMTALGLKKGGFVAPLPAPQLKVPTARIRNTTSTLSIFGIEIPGHADAYTDFCNKMRTGEAIFLKTLDISTPDLP